MIFSYMLKFRVFFFLFFLFFCTQILASEQYVIRICQQYINEGKFQEALDPMHTAQFPNARINLQNFGKEKIKEHIQNNTKCPFEALALANNLGIPIHVEENFKPQIIESIKRKMMHPHNTMTLEEAVEQGKQFGLELQSHLFPSYWTDFLKDLKEKPYDELLQALEIFSKNNLQGTAEEVFKDCDIQVCETGVTTQWLASVFNKVFGENGKYKGQIQAKQDFEWLVKALGVRDSLTHISLQMCNQVYTRMKQKNESIQGAYAHFLPPQICEEENLTGEVAAYVIEHKIQPEGAYIHLAVQTRKEKYKKDFLVLNEFAQSVAEYVTTGGKHLNEALFLSMKQPILVQNIDVRQDIAVMMVNQRGDFKSCEEIAKADVLRKIVNREKFGLEIQQIEEIVELWMKNTSLPLRDILLKALPPLYLLNGNFLEVLTQPMVDLMLTGKFTYTAAAREAKINRLITIFVIKKFPEELSKKIATFITDSKSENAEVCLKNAFETHLKDGFFEGKNLKPEIINFLMQNQNYRVSTLKAKQKLLVEGMQLKGFTLQEANAFAGLVVLHDTKKDTALKTILINHPKFLKNKDKINEAIKLILRDQNSLTVHQAWEELCVKPWRETICKNYRFPEEIQNKVANLCAERKTISDGLEIVLKEKFNDKEKFSSYLKELAIELLKNKTIEEAEEFILREHYEGILKKQKLDFLDIEEISEFIFKADTDFDKGFRAYIISKAPRLEETDFNLFVELCKEHKQKDLQKLEEIFLKAKYSLQFLNKYPAIEKNRAEEMARLIWEENQPINNTQNLLTMALRKIDQYSMEIAAGVAKILISSPSTIMSVTQAKDQYYIDLKSIELKKKYSKLEKDICDKLAKRLYENQNLSLENVLEEIFKDLEVGSENFSKATKMILTKDKSVEEVEAEFGLAPILKFYPMLKTEDAKAVATLIRSNKGNLRSEKDVKWALLIHIKSTYEYEDDQERFLDFLHKYKMDLFDCVAVLKKMKEKVDVLKFDSYFPQIISNKTKDLNLLKAIKNNTEDLTETESNQFLWDICEEAYQAGNLDDIETGFGVYLMKHNVLDNIPSFVKKHEDLQKNFFMTIAQYVLNWNGKKTLLNAKSYVNEDLLNLNRQKDVKINFYNFVKKEPNMGNLCNTFWLKYFEEDDVDSILCLFLWAYGWNGKQSVVPLMEEIMVNYFTRSARVFLKQENDEQYIIPRVRAIVKKMIKSQNGLKFGEADKKISLDIQDVFGQYVKKQPFLNIDLVEFFAYDSYFYPFVHYQEIENGLCKDWRLTYPDCFVKFFNVEKNKNLLIEHIKNVYPYDKKDLEGEGLSLNSDDYIETLSQQMEYLNRSQTISQGLEIFQKWLEVKQKDLKKLYLLEEGDLRKVTWSHFINKLEIELSLKRVLNHKTTIYGKITLLEDALPVAYILKNSKEPLTLEQAHRVHLINKKVDILKLPLLFSLKKEVVTQMVDKRISETEALKKIIKKYPLNFRPIPKETENRVFDLVSKGMPFEVAGIWTNLQQTTNNNEDNLIDAFLYSVASKKAYVQLADTVKRYIEAMEKVMGEEIHVSQAVCTLYDYIQTECAQILLTKNHALAVNTHLKNLVFNEETIEKLQEIPQKTWGKFSLIDCLRQQQNIVYDCICPGDTIMKNAEDIIQIYPEILEDPWSLDEISAAKLLRKAWKKIPHKILKYREKLAQNNNKIILKRKDMIAQRKNHYLEFDNSLETTRKRVIELREMSNNKTINQEQLEEFSKLKGQLNSWESNPDHPQNEKCISNMIEILDKREPVEFLLNCEFFKYNPFFMISRIDTLIPDNVPINEYREMRNNLVNFVHMSDDFADSLELKKALGRWFAWAGLDCSKYSEGRLFLELEGRVCDLYRKRMKYIYLNLLDPNKYEKKQVTHYLSLLDTEVLIEKCIDAATDAQDRLEALIPGSEELTLHQRIVMSLTSRLKEILDQFSIDPKYGKREGESVENRLFVEIVCKDHFSLPVQTEEMKYNSYGFIKINELELIVRDAVHIFEKELLQIIYDKIKPGTKSGKAAGCDIYLLDLVQWMGAHPKYCNELDCGSFFKFPIKGKQIPTFESTEPILIDLLEDCQVIRRKKSNSQEINIFEN